MAKRPGHIFPPVNDDEQFWNRIEAIARDLRRKEANTAHSSERYVCTRTSTINEQLILQCIQRICTMRARAIEAHTIHKQRAHACDMQHHPEEKDTEEEKLKKLEEDKLEKLRRDIEHESQSYLKVINETLDETWLQSMAYGITYGYLNDKTVASLLPTQQLMEKMNVYKMELKLSLDYAHQKRLREWHY